ncbi:MAG: hypothetical protein Q4G64_04815 [bacterium]|nr:hypothetical protein [bacterium]
MSGDENFAPGGSGRSRPSGEPAPPAPYPAPAQLPRPEYGGATPPPPDSYDFGPAPAPREPHPYGYPQGGSESFGGAAPDPAWQGHAPHPGRGANWTVILLGAGALVAIVVVLLWFFVERRSGPGPTIISPSPSNSWGYGTNPTLDALWDDCAAGDMEACDSLYRAAPAGTEYNHFGSTCGETEGPSYGGCDLGVVGAYGSDRHLDELWDECEAGDMEACNDLYWSSPVSSEYEDFGSTCGATESPMYGRCMVGDVDGYGTNAEFDDLWDQCEAGDMEACDDLYYATPVGSEYEEFGSTCGQTTAPMYGTCDTLEFSSYGDDPDWDVMWDRCTEGELHVCDDLFAVSHEGTEYREHADTCGGSHAANGRSDCIDPDHDAYGSDPYLDGLHDECAAGDRDSCTALYHGSSYGTEYQVFGRTCGGVYEEDDYVNACM